MRHAQCLKHYHIPTLRGCVHAELRGVRGVYRKGPLGKKENNDFQGGLIIKKG